MNYESKTEQLFHTLDKGATIIQAELKLTYLDALVEMGEIIFRQEITKPFSELTEASLKRELKNLPPLSTFSKEDARRAMQLAVLKGMKEATQPNHEMTPDAVSLFIGYLVNKITGYDHNNDKLVIFDPAVGSGNLLMAVMNQLEKKSHGIGSEADQTLLQLAYVNANLQMNEVDLFHQDSIATSFIKNVDLVVSDLPIGYYPKDDIADRFELKREEGHSFVHHLMIEQSLKHIKPGGFLILLVPNFIFSSEQAQELNDYIKKESHIYSFMKLPLTMFKTESSSKSILILRRKDKNIKEPRQALLVDLPSFSNTSSLNDILVKTSRWFDKHLN